MKVFLYSEYLILCKLRFFGEEEGVVYEMLNFDIEIKREDLKKKFKKMVCCLYVEKFEIFFEENIFY